MSVLGSLCTITRILLVMPFQIPLIYSVALCLRQHLFQTTTTDGGNNNNSKCNVWKTASVTCLLFFLLSLTSFTSVRPPPIGVRCASISYPVLGCSLLDGGRRGHRGLGAPRSLIVAVLFGFHSRLRKKKPRQRLHLLDWGETEEFNQSLNPLPYYRRADIISGNRIIHVVQCLSTFPCQLLK